MSLHFHSDKLIKTCPVCQQSIKEINEAGKELDLRGVWKLPRKIIMGKEYLIWKAK